MIGAGVVLACTCLCLVAAAGIARPWLSGYGGAAVPAAATRPPGRPPLVRRSFAPIAVGSALLLVMAAPFAVTSLRPPTGTSEADAPSPAARLASLEGLVARHPSAVNPRLELALAYLTSGDVASAAETYAEVLRLDPANAEAHARLGMILLAAGRPRLALREEDRALEAHPLDPEATFDRGIVLLRGLHDPGKAARAFHTYLRIAPSGSHRSEAGSLLRRLRRGAAGG